MVETVTLFSILCFILFGLYVSKLQNYRFLIIYGSLFLSDKKMNVPSNESQRRRVLFFGWLECGFVVRFLL